MGWTVVLVKKLRSCQEWSPKTKQKVRETEQKEQQTKKQANALRTSQRNNRSQGKNKTITK